MPHDMPPRRNQQGTSQARIGKSPDFVIRSRTKYSGARSFNTDSWIYGSLHLLNNEDPRHARHLVAHEFTSGAVSLI